MPKRGGDHGGGTTVRRLVLSERAARYLRLRATVAGRRYTRAEAHATANALLEALDAGQVAPLLVSEDVRAALAWLEDAKTRCFDEAAARGLDQIIAAVWTATARQESAA